MALYIGDKRAYGIRTATTRRGATQETEGNTGLHRTRASEGVEATHSKTAWQAGAMAGEARWGAAIAVGERRTLAGDHASFFQNDA